MTHRPANADELFDVVDLNDEVTGQAPRKEVHAKKWMHRATHVIVHDHVGRLFLQKRSMSKDTFPGCWDNACTGHLDAGENYETAARRELGEEIGWHDASLPLRPVLKLAPCPENGYEFIQIYTMGPISGPFEFHPEEISEGRWVAPSEIEAMMRENPDQFTGAMRLLWTQHRDPILAALVT
jgi:isopentenyl-diphosphate delta-isomerase type 1